MSDLVDALRAAGVADVRADEHLAAHTTLKVGGPATAFVRADRAEDLVAVARICAAAGVPWLTVGRGSNLLVADEGWPGVVVELGRGFRGVSVLDGESEQGAHGHEGGDGDVIVRAGAAEPMPVLATTLARMSLAGLAFGVAIPGSLGGAVRMNAGAHGGEMRDVLIDADVIRLADEGRAQTIPASALQMTYRSTQLPSDAVVVAARLRLRRADPDELAAEMAEMRQWRRDNQPINSPSCGSVFRNPEGSSAGQLIDQAGMKGYRIGGARVSEVHANFITVEPGARAQDVHDVITAVRDEVHRQTGVDLHTEVVVVGFGTAEGG